MKRLLAILLLIATPALAEVDTRSATYATQNFSGSYTNIGIGVNSLNNPNNVPTVITMAWDQSSATCLLPTMSGTALPANAGAIATIQGSGNLVNITLSAPPNGAGLYSGESVVISSTTHYNGTFIVENVNSGTSAQLYNQTQPPNTTLETSGTATIGTGFVAIPSSPVSISDGSTGHFCVVELVNYAANSNFLVPTLASGSATFIKAFGFQDENVNYTSSTLDVSASNSGTGTTITCPALTTTVYGDHVVCVIFQDTATDSVTVGTPTQPVAPEGLKVPFAQSISNNAINPVLLSPPAAQSAGAFIATEQWGQAPATLATSSVTTANSAPWVAIRMAFKPLYTDNPEMFGSQHPGIANLSALKVLGSFGNPGQVPVTDGSATVAFGSSTWFAGSPNTTVSNSTPNVFPINGVGTPVATSSEGTVASNGPSNTSNIGNMNCYLTDATGAFTNPGGSASYVVAVRMGLATSSLTCTFASGSHFCNNGGAYIGLTDSRLDLISTPSGTPTALIPHCSVNIY